MPSGQYQTYLLRGLNLEKKVIFALNSISGVMGSRCFLGVANELVILTFEIFARIFQRRVSILYVKIGRG